MNKRIRKKHAKQNWERMQKEMNDPTFWKRVDTQNELAWSHIGNLSGMIEVAHEMGSVRVVDEMKLWAISIDRAVGYKDTRL